VDQRWRKAPKEQNTRKASPATDTGVQAARCMSDEAVSTACRGNEEGRVKSHAHDARVGSLRRIAQQEHKAEEDNTQSLTEAVADDIEASLFAVDFPRPYPSENKRACKSTGSQARTLSSRHPLNRV